MVALGFVPLPGRATDDGPEPTAEERAEAARIIESIQTAEARRFSADRIAEAYRKAADAKARWLALAEFQDRRIPRLDAIRVLTSALADPDLSVRVHAARFLYGLGSPAGRDTLLVALRSAATVPATELPVLLEAARTLTRHHEAIPPDVLLALRPRFRPGETNGIMARQGDPAYLPYLMPPSPNEVTGGHLWNIGVLGAPQGRPFAQEIFATTRNPTTKVAAAWAMYRTGGDATGLDYVLQTAAATLEDSAAAKPRDSEDEYAWRALYAIRDERARDLLRRAVGSPRAPSVNAALASLFYCPSRS